MWEEKVDEIVKIRRKFQTLEVYDTKYHLNVNEIFCCHGAHLKSLHLSSVLFDTCQQFCDVLKQMPALENLDMFNVRFTDSKDSTDLEIFCLDKLQKISIDYGSLDFFRFLRSPNLKYLIVRGPPENQKHLVTEFLESCEQLEVLELQKPMFDELFSEKINKAFKFNLKKLFINCHCCESNENFHQFLKSQASSLEELLIDFEKPSEELYETIFTKLNVLKTLKIATKTIPIEKSFYISLDQKAENIKEIEFYFGSSLESEGPVRKVLENCPNVESIDFSNDLAEIGSKSLNFMASQNSKLKTLKLSCLKLNSAVESIFKNLKVLEIGEIEDVQTFLSFLTNNRTIESLKIGSGLEKLSQNEFNVLLNHPNLTQLTTESEIDDNQKIYEKIKVGNKSLKLLRFEFELGMDMQQVDVFFPCNRRLKWFPEEMTEVENFLNKQKFAGHNKKIVCNYAVAD